VWRPHCLPGSGQLQVGGWLGGQAVLSHPVLWDAQHLGWLGSVSHGSIHAERHLSRRLCQQGWRHQQPGGRSCNNGSGPNSLHQLINSHAPSAGQGLTTISVALAVLARSLQLQCTGTVPTVSIEKCDGVTLYVPAAVSAACPSALAICCAHAYVVQYDACNLPHTTSLSICSCSTDCCTVLLSMPCCSTRPPAYPCLCSLPTYLLPAAGR
jgi:hypothetical protein